MLQAASRLARWALRRAGFDIVRVATDDTADYLRLYGRDAVEGRRFYNVGAGSFRHPCWTNIDFATDWYAPVQNGFTPHDLTSGEPLPISDGEAELIYTSHVIEHVKDSHVARLFREAHRALRKGGIFRVMTSPDADTDFAAFVRGDESWFYWDEAYDRPGTFEHIFHHRATGVPLAERWLHHFASQLAPNDRSPSSVKYSAPQIMEIIERLGFPACLDFFTDQTEYQRDRPGNHVSWWTAGKISELLRASGFADVYRSGYGQSAAPVLRNTYYFDSTHPRPSLYVEAVR